MLVPVDLRLLGGRISLVNARRNQPCEEIVQAAADQQRLAVSCAQILCRLANSWFVPSARALLLPQGDALQIWPSERLTRPTFPNRPGSLSPRLSLEDVFSTSLSLSGPSEVAFHQSSSANAVVLYPHGLYYAYVPSFADQVAIRSAVMGGFMSDSAGGAEPFSHFDRQHPATAVQCCYELSSRPLGGGLAVVAVSPSASPEDRLRAAVVDYGGKDWALHKC
eukprot:s7457_g4.t1